MRRLILIFSLFLLLAGCAGGSSAGPRGGQDSAPVIPAAGTLLLDFVTEQVGDEVTVELRAPSAVDLYQVAGTLQFDPLRYEFVAVEAGGGLGQPGEALFVGQESQPGRVDFAYTQRWQGPGRNGLLRLLRLRVRATGQFDRADFSLDLRPDKLRARDSRRRDLAARLEGREAQR
jgi:hypothetical protein